MKKQYYFTRISAVAHYLSTIAIVAGCILIIPFIVGLIYKEYFIMAPMIFGFILPGTIAIFIGILGVKFIPSSTPFLKDSMFICVLAWLLFTLLGAVPYITILDISYLDACFETMSGLTTTGITMLTGLNNMPKSILFWRALTQWIGGLGILSMFILIGFKGGAAVNRFFMSESHKISARKPHPGVLHTVKTLWMIYIGFTIAQIVCLYILGLDFFDAVTHTFTTLSTGGFSIYDDSIAHYRMAGYANASLIEITYIFFMLLGGINFFVHYNVLTGNIKSIWKNIEVRHFWYILFGGIFLIFFSMIVVKGKGYILGLPGFSSIKSVFFHLKEITFQAVSILTTTGYATIDINTSYFTAFAKQIFLIFMVIGGCSGSTGGGVKVIRITTLLKLVKTRVFKLNTSYRTRAPVVIDKKIINNDEVKRIFAIFFTWILLLVVGGGITAFFSNLSAWESYSGMFSALGNIGPCYIKLSDMIALHPVVKITYMFGMLAGRLEIIPIIILLNRKFYK